MAKKNKRSPLSSTFTHVTEAIRNIRARTDHFGVIVADEPLSYQHLSSFRGILGRDQMEYLNNN
jgi:hypothetical protein